MTHTHEGVSTDRRDASRHRSTLSLSLSRTRRLKWPEYVTCRGRVYSHVLFYLNARPGEPFRRIRRLQKANHNHFTGVNSQETDHLPLSWSRIDPMQVNSAPPPPHTTQKFQIPTARPVAVHSPRKACGVKVKL